MLPYWDEVVRPFIEALDEGPIVEIGCASGDTTEKLAELAVGLDMVLHAIDPDPQFDLAEFDVRFGRHFQFHRERSHDALERIEPAAAVLIDGDHNWYTVHGELTRLERIAASAGCHFPLVMLHDVEWPYARRDMYYEPDAIPEEWRKPWAQRGIKWGQGPLDEDGGGVNSRFANALEEGGPRNGVLTAVEDFVAQSELSLEMRTVNGEAGLGLLISAGLLAASPAVRRQWERLHSPEFLLDQAASLARTAARETAARIEAVRRSAPSSGGG